jgi:hypothetical protein
MADAMPPPPRGVQTDRPGGRFNGWKRRGINDLDRLFKAAADMNNALLFSALIALTAATGCIPEPPRERAGVVPEAARVDEPYVFPASHSTLRSRWNGLLGDDYPLDAIDRHVPQGTARVECSNDDLIDYSGTTLRYHGAVKIAPPFQERLERFEQVVAEVATEVYGRPPQRIRHMGAFSCRTSRNRTYRLSEHALGNAIDVAGFDFAPATKEQPLVAGLPPQLGRSFEVRVSRHWNKTGQPAETHARFFDQLTSRLLERRDIFRSAIGPSHPGHHDHLHFDMSPWRFVRL